MDTKEITVRQSDTKNNFLEFIARTSCEMSDEMPNMVFIMNSC